MAYYVRLDTPSGRYIRTDVSDGRYLAHSAKGTEWSKGHKYIDKRWIQGAWHYLYPEMLEAAKRAGDVVKDTAKKATDTAKNVGENVKKRHEYAVGEMKKTAEKTTKAVKDTAEKATKAAKDFKNYSQDVDSRADRYKDAREQRDDRAKKAAENYVKTDKEYEKVTEEAKDAYTNYEIAAEVYGKDSEQARAAEEEYNKVEERRHDVLVSNQNSEKAFDTYYDGKKIVEENEGLKKAEAEKETAKYKASKALNKLLRESDLATRQGAQWLKNQLDSGNKWAMNTLAAIEEKGTSAVAKGNSFLSQLFSGSKKPAPVPISKRTYSGTGTKAQRREAVSGGPVSNNDYTNRPKKRR